LRAFILVAPIPTQVYILSDLIAEKNMELPVAFESSDPRKLPLASSSSMLVFEFVQLRARHSYKSKMVVLEICKTCLK